MDAVVVACTVCHVVGLLGGEAETASPPAAWPGLECCFTDGCIGHVWPEWPN
jgi:hypothetical protein